MFLYFVLRFSIKINTENFNTEKLIDESRVHFVKIDLNIKLEASGYTFFRFQEICYLVIMNLLNHSDKSY